MPNAQDLSFKFEKAPNVQVVSGPVIGQGFLVGVCPVAGDIIARSDLPVINVGKNELEVSGIRNIQLFQYLAANLNVPISYIEVFEAVRGYDMELKKNGIPHKTDMTAMRRYVRGLHSILDLIWDATTLSDKSLFLQNDVPNRSLLLCNPSLQ